MNYTATVKHGWFKIYINDLLHVAVRIKDLSGIQSYFRGEEWFCIEFYTERIILCEYNNQEKWKSVLKLIEDNLKFL